MEEIDRNEQLSIWITEYESLLFSICYRLTGDYFAAQDLTQESFLSAYRHFSEYSERQQAKSWLARIATNKSIDYLRRRGKESPADVPLGTGMEGDPAEFLRNSIAQMRGMGEPEKEAEEREARDTLKRRILRLPEPYRETAMLYFYEERAPGEIAEITGRKLKTTQTQIYRAREMLRTMYREEKGGAHGD